MRRKWVMVGHGSRRRGSGRTRSSMLELQWGGGKIVLSKRKGLSRRRSERKDVWRSEIKREK